MVLMGECAIDPQKARSDPTIGPLAFLLAIAEDLRAVTREAQRQGRSLTRKSWLRVFGFPAVPEVIALAGPVLGAPQAAMMLEKLVALGARRVLFIGWTGSLDPSLKPGEILIPEQAVSEEGTSRHYAPDPHPRPAPAWTREIKQALEQEGIPFRSGVVWTTDAPYRETWKKIRDFQTAGVAAVEMETAALFTVAAFRRVEAAALLIVSDELSGTRWKHAFRDPPFRNTRRQVRDWLFRSAIHLPV